jgi:hypothetical protein
MAFQPMRALLPPPPTHPPTHGTGPRAQHLQNLAPSFGLAGQAPFGLAGQAQRGSARDLSPPPLRNKVAVRVGRLREQAENVRLGVKEL